MGYQPNAKTNLDFTKPVSTPRDLLEFFESGYRKPEEVRIGMEVEKCGIHKSDYTPVTYLEQRGVRKIQEKMVEELNWKIERQEGKYITSMSRGGTHMTLEGSESMVELSGRTHPSIHDLARELRIHQLELAEMSRLYDVEWLGIGYEPFTTVNQFRDVRIDRFEAIEKFYGRSNKKSIETDLIASVQANIDYTSAEDARRKFQILLRLSPFIGAMYAHSPIKDGKNTGYESYRANALRTIDRRRFGIRKVFFSPTFSFEKWTDFCLRIPMMAIFRDGKWISVRKMTFAQFLKSGFGGHMPTMDDWVLHLSFIKPDVRIKNYIEMRICDSLPPFLIPSMQAVVKGLVYHEDGEKMMKELTRGWSFTDFATIYHEIAKTGMQSEMHGKKLLDYCKEILKFATANLRSLKVLNENGQDESIHLEPIKDFVFVKEKSPGRYVMENWDGPWRQNPERLIEWCRF